MKRDFYESPKSTPLMRLFWKAAGADHYILERATYSDQIKYTCLGGIVVSTGVLAGIAGGYAFHTIFEPRGSAIESEFSLGVTLASMLFGVVWGLVIFNIDRFIVTSTGTGDGTEAITADEIKGALPRIFMGMIIALTISKPVEIRMFKSEIDMALFTKQQNIQREEKKAINEKYREDLKRLNDNVLLLKNEITKAQTTYQTYDRIATEEWEGKTGTGEKGDGPAYRMKRDEANNYKDLWGTIKVNNERKIASLEAEQDALRSDMDVELSMVKEKSNKLDGLLERLHLAHKIAGFWVSLFITLLFMAIELTPIFFKLMLIKSPYDFLSDNVKELVKAERGIEVKYDYYQDKDGKERDLVIFHEAKRLITEKAALVEAQKELSDYAIAKWMERQKQLIDQDPSRFIKSDEGLDRS